MLGAIQCLAGSLWSTVVALSDPISSLATLAAAVAAFITIALMKQQHRASYTPQLFPANVTYVLRKNKDGVPFFAEQGAESEDYPLYAMHIAPLAIRNIGLGAAHSIVVGWDYDHASMVHDLASIGTATGMIAKESDELFRFAAESGRAPYFGFVVRSPSGHDRLVAALTPGETVTLSAPESLLNYIAFKAIAEVAASGSIRHEFDATSVAVEFAYKDIGGKSLHKRVSLDIHVYVFTPRDATPGSDHAVASFRFSVPDGGKSSKPRRRFGHPRRDRP